MDLFVFPALFVIVLWWLSTGVIIYLDNLPVRTFRWSMLVGTLALGAALYGVFESARDPSVAGAYRAFACSLVIWGWHQMSFYMGYVTGPRRTACPPGCSGWRHFRHAVETTTHHEAAIVLTVVVLVALTAGQPNQVAIGSFLILWWMHESARLNAFLGVRNLNEEFFPDHLRYLESMIRQRPMNGLLPVSIAVSSAAAVWLVRQAISPGATPFEATASTLLSAILILAILEHWLLVMPLPAARLWQWGLPARSVPPAAEERGPTPETGVASRTALEPTAGARS